MQCSFLSPAVLATIAVIGTIVATPSLAADTRDSYLGGTLGVALIRAKDFDVDSNRKGEAKVSPGLFAGTRIGGLPIGQGWPLYAEVGYQRFARNRIPYRVGARSTDLTATGDSLYAAAKLDIPFTERFGGYAKLGISRNKVDGSTPAGQAAINIDGSATGALVGIGLQYAFDTGLTLRGELTSYGKSSRNSDAGAVNVGLAYRF